MSNIYIATVASLAPLVAGHGQMNWPPSRTGGDWNTGESCTSGRWPHQAQGTCLWFNNGCQPGCSECGGADCGSGPCCDTLMAPTIDKKYRTYFDTWTWQFPHTPWSAPGFAPVYSPCGLAGGGYTVYPPGGGFAPTGVEQGFDGRNMPELSGVKTVWPQGSLQDVAWSINAHHGGGYAYRLCSKSNNLTEACFQNGHLHLEGNESYIQFGDDESNRTAVPTIRLTEGTNPTGSQWTRVPIPVCSGSSGGAVHSPGCEKPQFPAPLEEFIPAAPQFGVDRPGLYGPGAGRCANATDAHKQVCSQAEAKFWRDRSKYNIIDKVRVPDVPIGDYVLSFRWDSEQTIQVWTECADVTITASEVVV